MEVNERKKRIIWIDYAKAIAIIMVIVGHANSEFSLKYKWLEVMIYSIHIPLFFILSGYTFKVKSDTKGWIIKRIKRIMFPYLLFCFCITACHTLETMVLKQKSDFWIKLFSKSGIIHTLLITSKSAFSNLWFLPCLLFAEIIIFCILKYVKNNNIQHLLCLAPGIFILLFKINITLPFLLCTVIVSVMYIYIGYLLKTIKTLNNIYIYITTIMYEIFVLKCDLNQAMYNLDITYPFLFLITSIFGSLTIIEICKKIKHSEILNKIGLNTLYIYGFHFIAQNLIKISVYKISAITRYKIVFLIISTILNLMICFIAIGILNIIKKKTIKVYNSLTNKGEQ